MLADAPPKNQLRLLQLRTDAQQEVIDKQYRDIQNLKADLAQSNEELSRSTRAQNQQIPALIHELNQPLTAVIAYSRSCLYILKNQLNQEQIPNKLVHMLECMAHQAQCAGTIVHQMSHILQEGDLMTEKNEFNSI